MKVNKIKSTKRFGFELARNTVSKKAGSNILTISTKNSTDRYSTGQSNLTLTVREASALQSFLNENLPIS